MKRIFLSLIVAAWCTMSSYAQTELVATLSHGTKIQEFYGADALSEAYTAANEGDVITLSPGDFNAVDIEKAITVRGAGMQPMETNGDFPTQITGSMTINVPSGTSTALTIEGIQAMSSVTILGENLAPVRLLKSRVESDVYGHGISMNAFSCIFAGWLKAVVHDFNNGGFRNTTLNCLNCVMSYAVSDGLKNNEVAKIIATNCILTLGSGNGNVDYSVLTNCFIKSWGGAYSSPLPQTSSARNCIGVNMNATPDLFENIANSSNIMVEGTGESAMAKVFQTFTGAYPVAETYRLTETAATTYLGDDGTQVGIYGGPTPFDPTPTNPQVKKFTVKGTHESGKLKVKIDVE